MHTEFGAEKAINKVEASMTRQILWNPLWDEVERVTQGASRYLTGCVSAYCTVDGIRALMNAAHPDLVFVITRWRVHELACKVSDIEVFPFLRQMNIPLYIHPQLHAKIYLFADGQAICGSGNATSLGLGLAERQNVEAAMRVDRLLLDDELELRRLRGSSLRVTEEIYEEFRVAVDKIEDGDEWRKWRDSSEDQIIYQRHKAGHQFLLSDLPQTKAPTVLVDWLVSHSADETMPTHVIEDCCTFHLRLDMGREELTATLAGHFTGQPFVRAIVDEIRQ